MVKKNSVAFYMLSPSVLLMTALVFYPIIVTFKYSLQNINLRKIKDISFAGLENYKQILLDPSFWYAFQNSILVLLLVVVFVAIIGLLFALLLNLDTKIKGILTAVVIVPWALPPIVNGLIWRWIFHPSFGFLNRLLLKLHIIDEQIFWFSSRSYIILILALVVAWRNIPFCTIVLLASLQLLPKQLFEAARIDGASTLQQFFRITLPLLLPPLAIVLTMVSINAINIFDEVVTLLGGYPEIGSMLMTKLYLVTFSSLEYGLGSALLYIITIIAGLFGYFYIRNVYKEISYL